MPSRKISDLWHQTQSKAKLFLEQAEQAGIHLVVTSTYRSFAEQQALYNQGRNGNPGRIVTNAEPGSSFHNVRRAFDIAPLHPMTGALDWEWMDTSEAKAVWEELYGLARPLGLYWGGTWTKPDRPHFEDEWCDPCSLIVGPRGAKHFTESGLCRLALGK